MLIINSFKAINSIPVIPPALVPTDIANLVMWMDAAHPLYNSDGVGGWPSKGSDTSGMGSPGSGLHVPVYSATGGMKSKPAIIYNGTNDRHQGEMMMGTGSFTLILVGNIPICKGWDTFGNGWCLDMCGRSNGKVGWVLDGAGAAGFDSTGTSANASANSIRAIRFNNVTSASVMNYYENGSLLSSDTKPNHNLRTSSVGWYIGNDLNSLSVYNAGNVSEILGYDRALTDTEITNLHTGYLAPKYI